MTVRWSRLAAALVATLLAAGCSSDNSDRETTDRWQNGRLYIATGNTTGVYYQLGGGYADIISRHLPGYEARAEPTGASVENITRIVSGDMHIALALADTAADASAGRGVFTNQPQPIRSLAKIYRNFTHVIVRVDAEVDSIEDLAGKRVSTGSPNSGTDVLAGRILKAAGLDPDRDIRRFRLSLPETVRRIQEGTLDALFWSGGLPTPGISDLMARVPDEVKFLPITDLIEPLTATYGPVYTVSEFPKGMYGLQGSVPTIAVPTLVLVSADMPDDLAYQLTRLLYDYQTELVAVHPEGANHDRLTGAATDPVPLHPGAARYYRDG